MVPLAAHAEMPKVRRDPLDILGVQDDTRLAHLVPIRHGRLTPTPFTFYRGGAALMASDLINEADHGQHAAAIRSGRIDALSDI